MSEERRSSFVGQLGLRARLTATFMLGAGLVAAFLSVSSVGLSRSNLLDQRERLVTDRSVINAATLSAKIGSDNTDAQTLFGSLSLAGSPSVLIENQDGTGEPLSVSLDPQYGPSVLPQAMVTQVFEKNTPAIMRFRHEDELLLAVGVPMGSGKGAYFEINQINDIERSIKSLAVTLIGVSAAATTLGGLLGFFSSRRLLRPLAEVSQVAEAIALGKLDVRLANAEWSDDPDLQQLVSSFDEMVSALQTRIDRDARFASDVSHELRSPLTTFSASIEVLTNAREEMPDRAQIALDLLSSDMERFTQLVEDLLEISRFDAGAVRLETDEMLVVESIRMAVKTLSPDPIPVVADPDLEDLIIKCDKRRLMRILANFVDNAHKYAGGATSVTVERHQPDPSENLAEEPALETIRIAVEDEGDGVPESERERIFDRFSRGGLGGRRGSDLGVGLGLALAAEHARLQGGSVWAENRTDGTPGARFIVELPLIEADEFEGEFA
ncbi:MAG TPA: hypothetical protein DEG43_11045 [Acidimicrobiaceae bacterium]|nr:hypothetical protein [Acidimicrobiaceae bacterium]